ncbi:hypothetical protein PR001_g12798 [Phytophthora rubi]|nr:hypothetical protein PR001_g12798 [Phytophthora rubi]
MKFHADGVLKENPTHKAAKHLHPHVYRHLTSLGARDDLENLEDDTARDISLFNNRYNF